MLSNHKNWDKKKDINHKLSVRFYLQFFVLYWHLKNDNVIAITQQSKMSDRQTNGPLIKSYGICTMVWGIFTKKSAVYLNSTR